MKHLKFLLFLRLHPSCQQSALQINSNCSQITEYWKIFLKNGRDKRSFGKLHKTWSKFSRQWKGKKGFRKVEDKPQTFENWWIKFTFLSIILIWYFAKTRVGLNLLQRTAQNIVVLFVPYWFTGSFHSNYVEHDHWDTMCSAIYSLLSHFYPPETVEFPVRVDFICIQIALVTFHL